ILQTIPQCKSIYLVGRIAFPSLDVARPRGWQINPKMRGKKHRLNENSAADICGRANNFIGSVSFDSCSQRIIRWSTIQTAEGVPGHLERQNRTAAEDAKSSYLVAWTLELEGEKFACLNSVESLAARTPEVYLRWLWPRG